MNLSLSPSELLAYTACQLATTYPDGKGHLDQCGAMFDLALSRLEHCFSHVAHARYNREGNVVFNHLYSDHYLVYLWFLANSIWKSGGDPVLANKLYYLNKTLHGFDCLYDTGLPDVFLVFHGAGTMLGKAAYSDFLVVLQGCTVGSHKGCYPTFGRGVALTSHSAIVGRCNVGDRVSIGCYTTIFQKDLPSDSTAFRNETGAVICRASVTPYAQQFFTTRL